ncbi:hypothetical protein [Pyruvatibacter sp.]|uniref:hypothetical protein n=1 Tax=Pyruvatibacter sp. TaxID=1981328 RepID=UPI0032EB16B8
MARTQYSRPFLVPDGAQAVGLDRIHLGDGLYDEAWLQNQIHHHPECLPIDQIEPALDRLVPVCLEMELPNGYVDNVFVTPSGDVVLAEVKLWRNPEMRRKVVAQALDYASCLFKMDYEAFETAVLKARSRNGDRDLSIASGQSLYQLMAEYDALDEAGFIDAVSNNLLNGRVLILVVGDGVHSQTEQLFALLEHHAGLHFTFALVELAIFALPHLRSHLILPRTLAQTTMITRSVIEFADGRGIIEQPVPHGDARTGSKLAALPESPRSISSDQFFDAMSEISPALPAKIQTFLNAVSPLGVFPDFRKALILRWTSPQGITCNLGYIQRDGLVQTVDVHGKLPRHLTEQYIADLANRLEKPIQSNPGNGLTYVGDDHRKTLHIHSIADDLEIWRDAIEAFAAAVKAYEAQDG